MKLTLKTYKPDKKTVAKTYTVNSIDLSFGVVRDTMCVLNPEQIDFSDKSSIGKAILSAWDRVEPLYLDLFPGITSEELGTVKLSNMAEVAGDIFAYMKEKLDSLGDDDDEKN